MEARPQTGTFNSNSEVSISMPLRIVFFILCFPLSVLQSSAVSALEKFNPETEGKLFTLQGSNTVGARLAPTWAERWLAAKGATGVHIEPLANENEYRVMGRNGLRPVYVDIHAHGSTTGFKGLLAKTADIAMASRPIKMQEVEALKKDNGDMLSFSAEHVVAIDGLAVIVHPSNRISSLSVGHIQKIFSGQIKNWIEIGGPNRPIHVYARDDKSGTYDTFKSLVLKKTHKLIGNAKRFESNDELSDTVSSDASGIGFVGLASVRSSKALAISEDRTKPLLPKTIHVATEDYPLSRRLFMYTPEVVENNFIKEFITFAHSDAGQAVVEEIGFISQNPVSLKVADLIGPNEYQQLSDYAERLSVNFRFQPGQADLDNKALHDVLRLVKYVNESNAGSPVQIQLVGFSNTEESETRADVLSKLRASAVKIELFRYGLNTAPIMGFGSEILVANNEGNAGIKNERVEVWVFNPADKRAMKPEPNYATF
ncbi:phosphate transport system substrate-binding protein [Alteromonadaceae bacterium 2753L.S.0a.02]|nr:phosphate transport system substrate-binding protein [Alteromonadaceae bacterium 2753L.S.0a.02]